MKRPNPVYVVLGVFGLCVLMSAAMVSLAVKAEAQAEAPPPKPNRWQEWGVYHTNDNVNVTLVCDYERKDLIYTARHVWANDGGVGIFVVPGGCK